MNLKKQIFSMAKQDIKTLIFPEASFSALAMSAIKILTGKHLAKVILIGEQNEFFVKYNTFENNYIKIIDPKASELKREVQQKLHDLLGQEKMTDAEIQNLAEDPYYFSATLVLLNYADGIVSGSESISTKTYTPAFDILKKSSKDTFTSSGVLLIGKNKFLKNRSLLVADPTINKNPTEHELVKIAKSCVDFWKVLFIQEPKVAFLSYLTNDDGQDESLLKMKKATKLFNVEYPDVISDGEMQLDCAILPTSQKKKFPNCKIKGDANILIVPEINSGNCVAKALQYVGDMKGIGAIGFGFVKPVNVVSRNATVEEIVFTSVITAIQAQV